MPDFLCSDGWNTGSDSIQSSHVECFGIAVVMSLPVHCTYMSQSCTHVHRHVRSHACTYVHHVCTHVRTYVHTYAHTYARTYTRTHARTHTRALTRTHVRTLDTFRNKADFSQPYF